MTEIARRERRPRQRRASSARKRTPVGRGEQRARNRVVAPLAADPDHGEDEDEEAARVRREHVDQHRLRAGAGESVATSGSQRSEKPTAAPARPMAVRVVRSFRNSACSRAVMRATEVSSRKASSSERETATQLGERHAVLGRHRAHLLGRSPRPPGGRREGLRLDRQGLGRRAARQPLELGPPGHV